MPMFEETIVYKCPGLHHRKGGTYSFLGVKTQKDFDNALDDGWHETLDAAIEAHDHPARNRSKQNQENDDAPPTREELEAKAKELNIEFDGRTSDKKLLAKINEAMQAQ